VACLSTKAAISLKRVKIEEKLLWRAIYIYIGTQQRSFERYNPDPLWPPLPKEWGCATSSQNSNRYYLIPGTGEATDFWRGVGKIRNFQPISRHISETVQAYSNFGPGPKLLLMTNSKLHMRFRLVPKSMTLDDLELL